MGCCALLTSRVRNPTVARFECSHRPGTALQSIVQIRTSSNGKRHCRAFAGQRVYYVQPPLGLHACVCCSTASGWELMWQDKGLTACGDEQQHPFFHACLRKACDAIGSFSSRVSSRSASSPKDSCRCLPALASSH